MITVENKETAILRPEGGGVTYAELLSSVLNRPVQEGVDLKAMRRDFKLLDQLDTAGETIDFSNEDFTYLKGMVGRSQWGIKHRDIITFADYIDTLDSVAPVEAS